MKKFVCWLAVVLCVLFSAAALAEEAPPAITVDGDLSDWAGIYSLSEGDEKIAILYAFKTDDMVYAAFQAPDLTNISVYDVMFDTDNNPATGYQCDGRHKTAGADFLVETWTAGTYAGATGSEWEWNEASYDIQRAASRDNTTVEIGVPLSILGNPEMLRITAWSMNSDWVASGFAPKLGEPFAEVPYYKEVIGAPITDPLTEIGLAAEAPVQALTENALPGGTVGNLTAKGGDGKTYDFTFRQDANKGRDNSRFVIKGNVLMVGEASLSPGTYKVAVQCQSLIRKETANLVVEVLPQDPATAITTEVFDGADGEWYAVPHAAAYKLPNVTALKAQTDGRSVFFFAEAQRLGEDYAFYIGNEITTGQDMAETWAGAAPANRIDPDGSVWVWQDGEYVKTDNKAQLHKTEKGVEGLVAIGALHSSAKAFTFGFSDGEGCFLPDAGAPMLKATAPERLFSPGIRGDGTEEDWTYVQPLCQGSGVVGEVYAARTDEFLYVMTTVSGVTDPESDTAFSLNILVDADGNPVNGYRHPGYSAHSGMDVLVQDWHSLNLEFFVYEKPSDEWFSCVGRPPEGIKKFVEEQGDGVYKLKYAIPVKLVSEYLPEVSDDWYIAVDRQQDMQEGTTVGTAPEAYQEGSGLLLVPKYRTRVAHLDVADDTFADWDAVGNKVTPSSQAATQNLRGTLSEERLYLLANGQKLDTTAIWLLSTGKGFAYAGYSDVTHLVKGGKLYAVTADDTLGAEGLPIYTQYYADSAEVQVYLEDLGWPEQVFVAYQCKDTQLPAEGMMAVTQRFALARPEGAYFPREDFGAFPNPYHGWMAWASTSPEEPIRHAFDTVFLDVKWAEFEPEKGKYDFEILEKKYHLDTWKERGVRVILRFVIDDVIDNGGADRMDIPAWLYEELVAENAGGKGAGTFYYEAEALGGGGFSPNYDSPLLIGYHAKAIAALAERFDDPAITAYVQVGSLGHWAEMHCWPEGTGEFPNPDLVGAYMQAYTEAFHRVKLAARKPYPYASAQNWGLYNDMFGDVGASDTWVDYYRQGCTDMPSATSEHVAASAMPEFWLHGYSGGEFAEGNVRKWISDDAIVETLRLIREAHSSLIGPCAPTDLLTTEADTPEYDVNVEAMSRIIGWRYALESITQISTAKAGDRLVLELVWNNRGVSPFYYPWPLEWSLVDEAGKVVYAQRGELDIRTLLPGRKRTGETLLLPSDLPQGTYRLCVAVLDVDTGVPSMRLALAGGGEDLRYPLYPLTIQ